MPYDRVAQDGFEFAHNSFRTTSNHIEREEPHVLRNMFLPTLSLEGRRKLNDHHGYVRSQLEHYGVDYDEEEFTGQGINLLKKLLRQGKLDKVPDHIERLKSQLATRWYNQLTVAEMADTYPEKFVEWYFLDSLGRPDRSKTTDVLTIPLPYGVTLSFEKLAFAANKVAGLHRVTREDSVYIGWDWDAVEETANGHERRMKQKKEKRENKRDQERACRHASYLREIEDSNVGGAWSPAGSYIVDCNEIQTDWLEGARHDLTLDISPPNALGFYKASFNFGIVEGVMILSDEKSTLDDLSALLYSPVDYEGSEDDEYDEDPSATGSKRKAAYNKNPSPKRAKRRKSRPRTLFLMWKGMGTGEGMALYEAERGSITFSDPKYSRLSGKMNIKFIGDNIPFLARKVSGVARACGSWNDNSESKYNYSARW
ncbi:hypothetical protein F4805DRAFT_455272 [Annulohypoxylon moriforme]|nr:hypothetical protein F4805DRAFT_455272 [Annulohypoxylon moriforme]